jgi:hypothetical protein
VEEDSNPLHNDIKSGDCSSRHEASLAMAKVYWVLHFAHKQQAAPAASSQKPGD